MDEIIKISMFSILGGIAIYCVHQIGYCKGRLDELKNSRKDLEALKRETDKMFMSLEMEAKYLRGKAAK